MPEDNLGARNSAENKTDAELEELRDILVPADIRQLSERVERADSAENISRHIAEAVVLSQVRDSKLSVAFEPILETAMRDSLRKRPQEFINILFPLIGSTIRKSISETFSSMLGEFSKSLESAFSPKGIKWRMEAMRTGKPFSEVVMLHTVIYRVEQIYLIHSATGLVLTDLIADGVDNRDADMVSGMLTAIQDFARDCFNTKSDTGSLNSLEMGERTVYIERSSELYIAAVVRGKAPNDLLVKIREALELILVKCGEYLVDFKGDASPFIVAVPYLQNCFSERLVEENKKAPLLMRAIPWALLFLAAFFISWKVYHTYRMNSIVNVILKEPGVLLFNVERFASMKPWVLHCLKDDLASPIMMTLVKNGFKSKEIKTNCVPFDSHNPEIVMRKLRARLKPPETAHLAFYDGTLTMTGSAETRWITEAKQSALSTPGVYAVNTQNLVDPHYLEINKLINEVESTVIRFPHAKDIPIKEDTAKFDKLVRDLVDIERMAQNMGFAASLTIYGHADSTGSERINYEISQARAKTIAAKLYANRSGIPIAIYGMGSDYSTGAPANEEARKVEFRVHLSRAVDTAKTY